MAKYFNNNVKMLRKAYGFSQDYVAEKTGVTRTVLSRIENGLIETSAVNAYNLSQFYGLPMSMLVGEDLTEYTKFASDDLKLIIEPVENKYSIESILKLRDIIPKDHVLSSEEYEILMQFIEANKFVWYKDK